MSTFSNMLEPLEPTKKFVLGLPENPKAKPLQKRQKQWLTISIGLMSPDNLLLFLEAINNLTDSIDEWWVEMPAEFHEIFNNLDHSDQLKKEKITFWQMTGMTLSLTWASVVCFKNFFKLFESTVIRLLAAIEEQISIDEASEDLIQVTLNSGQEKTVKLRELLEDNNLKDNIQYKSESSISILPRRTA
ncbi:hypothetical protein [Phormidium tenue]|jgi:hypothetical protein|uniref:Uncharacterized protein n=1 Tax=Phormidium tenue FACHB-1050 TaxID=2692857 RepID=A0ABR8CHV0_9CYAN|nr:hypothetical protein [Phormidium tenue]MBD2319896.1 hypothetical protein [Phormidium tenue FACHB-1050]